ncbi:MAG: patatin-like phospholipase family protein [Spirochaetales bacterium]|nr:patatin-like phospholipase family protein [Spirochaetales bacterium]
MEEKSYCLVLSGGGAKGVYHVGMWRALQELGIQTDCYVGNSIGAIIAAFLAQGLGSELEDLGNRIGIDYILNVPEDLIENGELKVGVNPSSFRKFYKSLSLRGLDTSPLRALLNSYIDEKTLRESGNDFGVVTVNVSDMKSREVYLEDIEEGELINYVLASSAFPGFESPQIGGKKYVDGGLYDNIPFAMAKARGYKRFIIVDISGMGINRRPDISGVETIYIKNSINMGGVLDFNREFLDDYILLGYLDTMKTFERYVGHSYFFVPDEIAEAAFTLNLESMTAREVVEAHARRHKGKPEGSLAQLVKSVFPRHSKHHRNWMAVFADAAAMILDMPRIRPWDYREFAREARLKAMESLEAIEALNDEGWKALEAGIRAEIKERRFLRTPYFYHLFLDAFLPGPIAHPLEALMAEMYPELPAGLCMVEFLMGAMPMEDVLGDVGWNTQEEVWVLDGEEDLFPAIHENGK